jgi:ubiquinone/menaquinone biosynthesis C-methylase UbiE
MDRQQFFDHHAAGWDETRDAEGDARLARVVALAEVLPGHSVLDVGTGTGVLVPHLLRIVGPDGKIAAIDLSSAMLEVARQKRFPGNVSFHQADVSRIPFADAAFDRVICNAAFPHFEDRAKSLQEMIRVLRPRGILVISHPIGRAAVNARHREAAGPVEQDRVPAPNAMSRLLTCAGLSDVQVIDEPQFYLARGRKP